MERWAGPGWVCDKAIRVTARQVKNVLGINIVAARGYIAPIHALMAVLFQVVYQVSLASTGLDKFSFIQKERQQRYDSFRRRVVGVMFEPLEVRAFTHWSPVDCSSQACGRGLERNFSNGQDGRLSPDL